MCFPKVLGKSNANGGKCAYTESKRGKSVSTSREAVEHVAAERAFQIRFGIFLGSFPGMTVTENRPNRAYSVYIPPASSLGDGAGRGEGRKQGMIDGF